VLAAAQKYRAMVIIKVGNGDSNGGEICTKNDTFAENYSDVGDCKESDRFEFSEL